MAGDKLAQAYPNNIFKQDWAYFVTVPGRGGASLTTTGVTRYTFWIDYDPFDIYNKRLISQNASFQIFNSGGTPVLPAIIVDQSNDITDELIAANVAGLSAGQSVNVRTASVGIALQQPPYYLDTHFVQEPASSSFQTDQGRYTMLGYANIGVRFGGNVMYAQGFVPTQPKLTSFFLASLFTSNGTDPSVFYDINLELWDSSHNFIQHLGTLHPTVGADTATAPNGLQSDSSVTVFSNFYTYSTCTDGQNRWISVTNPNFVLTTPVDLTVGSTYYLVVRQSVQTATGNYYLGVNIDNTGVRIPMYYYPYANAYSAADGSSTWSELVDNNSLPVCFPFQTQGNLGRTAVTFWWQNIGSGAANKWYGTPATNEFKFLHLDYEQRI